MALVKFDRWKILSGEIVPEKVVPIKYQPYSKNAKGATVVDLNLDTIDNNKKLLSLHTAKTSQNKFNQVIDTEFQDFPIQTNDNAIVLLQNRLNALLGEKNSLLSERDVNRDRIDELNKIIEDLRLQLRDALNEFAKIKPGGISTVANEIPDSLAIGFDGIFLYDDRTGAKGAPGYPLIQNQLLSKNRKARLIIQGDGNCVITKGEFDGKGNPLTPPEIVISFGWDDGETGPNFLHFARGNKDKKQAYVAIGGLWPSYLERWKTPVFDNVSNQARVVLDDIGSLSIYDRDRLLWSSFAIEASDFNVPYTRPEFKRDGSKGSGWEAAQADRKRRQEEEAARQRAAEEERRRKEEEERKRREEEERKRAKSLGGMLQDAGKSISSAFSDAGKNIASTTKDAVKSIGSAVSDAGKNVASTAKAAVTSVASATKSVGKAIGKLFKSDRRLKTDINLIGVSPSGINIYEFRFIADPSRKYQGVIADELLNSQFSDAVYIDADGYYAVDYTKIDVDFKEIEYL